MQNTAYATVKTGEGGKKKREKGKKQTYPRLLRAKNRDEVESRARIPATNGLGVPRHTPNSYAFMFHKINNSFKVFTVFFFFWNIHISPVSFMFL